MNRTEIRAHFDRAVEKDVVHLTRAALTKTEIANLLTTARMNLTQVAPHNRRYPWVAYNALYDACRQATDALLGAYGHKAIGAGAHEHAFRGGEAIFHALGSSEAESLLADVRTVVRQRRHEIHYEGTTNIDSDDLEFAQHVAERVVPLLTEETLATLGLGPEQIGVE
ncbi:MAG: hypothetical protein E6J03_11140 [Chloroflexi bacterium]|nr:MAG: hypothetical protein E6J03_11140 [Chloroflexota bacterium]